MNCLTRRRRHVRRSEPGPARLQSALASFDYARAKAVLLKWSLRSLYEKDNG